MKKRFSPYLLLFVFVFLSFVIKLALILIYKNQLTLASDDLNYYKSAAVLVKRGIFIFHNYNEPTVFVMPLYPIFLAGVFKVIGLGLAGIQAVRIAQAVLSCISIVIVFLMAKELFDARAALISAFLVSFYIPNIVTVGYLLTETLFTTLFLLLMYLSIRFAYHRSKGRLATLSLVWTAAILVRPTIALYPVILFSCLFFFLKINLKELFKHGITMLVVLTVIMSPWWVRNYLEYGEFIPLAASSGNPMLQGTYINYKQTPENIVYYNIGKNAFETNKAEVQAAKKRMAIEFKKNFWAYLRWYTLGKTFYLWMTIFYWKQFFNIGAPFVYAMHQFFLLGFVAIFTLFYRGIYRYFHARKSISLSVHAVKDAREKAFKYTLPVLVILYFNAVHCYYMAFDRYAFPLLPILGIYSSYLLSQGLLLLKGSLLQLLGRYPTKESQ